MADINDFIIPELPTHSGHMRLDIFLHQEEPRAHCTSEMSDNGLRISSQYLRAVRVPLVSVWRFVRPSKDIPPPTITDPTHRKSKDSFSLPCLCFA